jgi:hypothetical protein
MIFPFTGRDVRATASFISIGLSSFAAFADHVSKAETSVPTVTYRSVFRETSLGIEQEKLDWRKANDDVGKFTRGHVDILKQEEMEGKAMDAKTMDEKKSMDNKPMPTKPASPATLAPHKH